MADNVLSQEEIDALMKGVSNGEVDTEADKSKDIAGVRRLKRFREKRLEEVLRSVKAAFGDDAVILSTKKGDGFVEIMAVVDFDIEEIEKQVGDDTVKKELDGLRKELFELKHLFSSIVKDTAIREIAGFGRETLDLYHEMIGNGIHKSISQSLLRAAASSTEGEMDIRDRCYRIIKEKTLICNPLAGKERPRLLALLGPTGVGKTTTIVKLAGILSRRYRIKVGVISMDNRGPAANETLKSCGSIFDVSLVIPRTRKEFNKVVWDYKDKDLILIDTPGMNPKDTKAITELKEILNGGLPIKTGLVLSVTNTDDNLLDAGKGFGILPIDCLVFTKIDEARIFGSILNTSVFMKKPVAYLCNGQRILQDIKVASPEVVGELVFGRR